MLYASIVPPSYFVMSYGIQLQFGFDENDRLSSLRVERFSVNWL